MRLFMRSNGERCHGKFMGWEFSSAVFNLEKTGKHSFLSVSPGSENESRAKFKSEVNRKDGSRKGGRDREPCYDAAQYSTVKLGLMGRGKGGVPSRKCEDWSQCWGHGRVVFCMLSCFMVIERKDSKNHQRSHNQLTHARHREAENNSSV